MSTTLLSYSTSQYRLAQRALCLSGRANGVDRCISFTGKDLAKTEFYRKNKTILDHPRGGGYWLWKPYYILETLKQLPENDILIYADAGIIFRKSVTHLTNLVSGENDVALFYNGVKAAAYTKRDVFIALNCDKAAYHDAPLIHAGLQVYRKTKTSLAFAEEVLASCLMEGLITDAPNIHGLPDLPGFIENRHDQSIFSLVAHKHCMTLFLDPTQFRIRNANFVFGKGDIPLTELPYHSVAYVHRYKNLQMWRLFIDVLKSKSKTK